MKKIVTLIVLFFTLIAAKGQDQIITKAGDTLKCKITRVTADYIHFQLNNETGPIRTRIEQTKVTSYEQAEEPAPTPTPEVQSNEPQEPTIETGKKLSQFIESNRFRILLNGGFTYQLGGYAGTPSSYSKQVKSMFNMGGEFQFFPFRSYGIGLKYSRASTSAQETFDQFFSQALGFNTIQEKIRFHYVALSLLNKQPRGDNMFMYYSLSFGKMFYRNDGTTNIGAFFQEGDTFSLGLGAGFDFLINSDYAIGVGADLIIGKITEFDVPGGTVTNQNFEITRIDLTLGFRLLK